MYIYLTRWAVLLKRWFVTGLCGYLTHSRLVPSGLLTGPIANNVACWQTQLQIMCPADRPHCKWCGLLTSPIANDVACWPAELQMMWPADQPNWKWCGLLTSPIANDACWPAQLQMALLGFCTELTYAWFLCSCYAESSQLRARDLLGAECLFRPAETVSGPQNLEYHWVL